MRYGKCSEKQSGHTVTPLHADNGMEVKQVCSTLCEDSIHVTTITIDTLESNRIAERTHQTIRKHTRNAWHEQSYRNGFRILHCDTLSIAELPYRTHELAKFRA